jgi:hypothetical protein
MTPRQLPFLPRLALILGLAALVQGCQTGLPGLGGAAGEEVTPNAVAGDAIEVTALDDGLPPAQGSAAPPPEAAPAAGTQETEPATEDAEAVPEAEPAPQPDLAEEVPPTPKSEQQVACERRGGQWSRAGSGSLRICVFATRDGGKQCTRESQCEGVCLARSGTCSPVKPLLGCNEILQDNGARVTLCIE